MCLSWERGTEMVSWARFPLLSLDHSKGLGQKQLVPVAVGHYHGASWGPPRGAAQCQELWSLELRLLLPRPVGYKPHLVTQTSRSIPARFT